MTSTLAVADIHLDLKKNREWEQNRFLALFQWLSEQKHSTIFLLGDVFNTNSPSLDEIDIFYRGINLLKDKKVILIDGNHEAISKGVSVFDKIPEVGYTYIKNDILKIEGIRVYLVSWTELHRLDALANGNVTSLPKVLLTHVRSNVPPHIREEVPLEQVSKTFNKVIAGDIHLTNFKPFDNFFYTGQPYSTQYKAKGLHSILELNFDRRGVEVTPIYTTFANKIVMNITPDDIPNVNKVDKYLFKVSGTITELAQLENTFNITYDKTITDISGVVDKDYVVDGKLNVKQDILQVLEDKGVSKPSIKYGEEFINSNLKDG